MKKSLKSVKTIRSTKTNSSVKPVKKAVRAKPMPKVTKRRVAKFVVSKARKSKEVSAPSLMEVSITNLRKDIFTFFEKVHGEKRTILVKKDGRDVGYLVPTE